MSRNALALALITNFFGIFLISLAGQFDLKSLYVFLASKNYHQNEIEHIELLEMLGQMIFSLFLAQIINLPKLKKLLLIFLVILSVSNLNILFLQQYNIVKIHLLIIAGCKFNILIIYLLSSLAFLPNSNNKIVIIFASALLFGTLAGELIYNSATEANLFNYKLLSNLLYLALFISAIFTPSPPTNNLFKINFINIIKNIELELLAAFVLGYVALAIYWEYQVFAIKANLKIDTVEQVHYHIMANIVLAILLWQSIVKSLHRYLVDIILLIALLLAIISLRYIGDNYHLNLIAIYVIGIALCLIWLNNLAALSEKFESENLKTAICFYFAFLSIGSYLGMAVTEEIMNKIDEWGFIYSICFVVGLFMLYYVTQKNK